MRLVCAAAGGERGIKIVSDINDLTMTIDEMISQLDGACGRLLVASRKDPVVREAMEMVTEVSVALGEMGEKQ
jgi:hypothetical protein